MTSRQPLLRCHRLARLGTLLALALSGAALVQAQGVYRIVDPSGRVTYADKPPATAPASSAVARGAVAPSGTAALPFALRQAVERYPVVLYTGDRCDPCTAARSFLVRRGVPFAERTVTKGEDVEALQRITGSAALPSAQIGTLPLRGFSEPDWERTLDAAGYPSQSVLPPGYTPTAASPLAVVQTAGVRAGAAADPAAPAAAQPQSPPVQDGPRLPPPPENRVTPDNPRGIRF